MDMGCEEQTNPKPKNLKIITRINIKIKYKINKINK